MKLNAVRFMKLNLIPLLLCFSLAAKAGDVNGVLQVVKGDVQIKSAKDGSISKAKIGSKVFPKDTIITGKDARAKIVMVDNNVINVSPETSLEIKNYEYQPEAGKKDVLLNVLYGKVRSKVEQKYDGKSTKFQVKTPTAVAGVRGTDFMASYTRSTQTSSVVTFEGQVQFGQPGPGGTIQNAVPVSPGQYTEAKGGQAPPPAQALPPQQLAQMDSDSKAEGPGGKDNNDSRTPAGKNEGDKDKDKKDGEGDKKNGEGDKKNGEGDKKNGEGDKKNGEGDKKNGEGDKKNGEGDKKNSSAGDKRGANEGNKSDASKNASSGSSSGTTGASAGAAAGTPNASGTDGTKSDSAGAGPAGPAPNGTSPSPTASAGAGAPGGAPPPAMAPMPGDMGRSPANAMPSLAGMLRPEDFAGAPTANVMPSLGPVLPPLPPPIPQVPQTPVCDFCNRVIQDGNNTLIITVTH